MCVLVLLIPASCDCNDVNMHQKRRVKTRRLEIEELVKSGYEAEKDLDAPSGATRTLDRVNCLTVKSHSEPVGRRLSWIS